MIENEHQLRVTRDRIKDFKEAEERLVKEVKWKSVHLAAVHSMLETLEKEVVEYLRRMQGKRV